MSVRVLLAVFPTLQRHSLALPFAQTCYRRVSKKCWHSSKAKGKAHAGAEKQANCMLSRSSYIQMKLKDGEKAVVIGVAADSGCGKSTFMRRPRALTRVEHREKRRAST